MATDAINTRSKMNKTISKIIKKNIRSKLKGANVTKPKDVSASKSKDEIESEEFTMGFKLVVLLTNITDK